MRTAELDVGDANVKVLIGVEEDEFEPAFGALTPASKTEGTVKGGASEKIAMRVLTDAVRAVSSRFRQELEALADPDELSLEFGASLQGGVKVLLAATGTFKVTVKWTKRQTH